LAPPPPPPAVFPLPQQPLPYRAVLPLPNQPPPPSPPPPPDQPAPPPNRPKPSCWRFAFKPFDPNWPVHYLGKMDVPCSNCGALHWIDERLKSTSI
jgi:hypothetical protein